MPLTPGDTAPTFSLPAKPGEMVDVGRHIGRDTVVLLFFPLAFSPTCTDEMCHFRDHWSEWEHLGATVFGISVDSLFVTAKFREENDIPFPILSDFNREVGRQYDVLHEDRFGMKDIARRSAFVIGPNGTVTYAWATDDAGVQVKFDEIKQAVAV